VFVQPFFAAYILEDEIVVIEDGFNNCRFEFGWLMSAYSGVVLKHTWSLLARLVNDLDLSSSFEDLVRYLRVLLSNQHV
jgi:hypothetical protein